MRAKIFITLKKDVLDPQGMAIEHALNNKGYNKASKIRQGKLIEMDLNTKDKQEAESQVKDMCKSLLVNSVIENYNFELIEN